MTMFRSFKSSPKSFLSPLATCVCFEQTQLPERKIGMRNFFYRALPLSLTPNQQYFIQIDSNERFYQSTRVFSPSNVSN